MFTKKREKQYKVDQIVSEYDVIVLCLPLYFCISRFHSSFPTPIPMLLYDFIFSNCFFVVFSAKDMSASSKNFIVLFIGCIFSGWTRMIMIIHLSIKIGDRVRNKNHPTFPNPGSYRPSVQEKHSFLPDSKIY